MRRPRPKAPRRKAKQERSRNTVETILTGAAQILGKLGFERTTTDRIAKAAGISVGSLYQYFPNKEAIVAALIERHFDAVMRLFEDKMEEARTKPVADGVAEVVRTMIAAQIAHADLHRVLGEQVPNVGQTRKLRALRRDATRAIRAFLGARKRELVVGDLDVASFIVVETVDSLVQAASEEAPEYLADERLANELTALITRYLVG